MITVTGLTKQYGKSVAVDDMTFDVAAGRVTGFVGPNGAGKSTTMRMMVGLTRPQAGDVRYSGVHYRDLKHPARTVGSVLDARCMHPGRTARNHLRATAALSSIPSARVAEVLGEVGLEPAADKRAGTFSLGMRQRLALASALLGDPQVLLLDEPSNGLDPDGIRWLRNYLSDFARRGGTVFVSSHLISELGMFADDLVVVGGGRLLAAESVGAITARNDVAVRVETSLDDVRLLEARVVIGFWDHAAGQAELIAFHESAMETWRAEIRPYLRQAQSAGELTAGRPHERIIDAVLALTTGFQVNACFSPQHNTPERRMAVLDDLLAGVRGPGVT